MRISPVLIVAFASLASLASFACGGSTASEPIDPASQSGGAGSAAAGGSGAANGATGSGTATGAASGSAAGQGATGQTPLATTPSGSFGGSYRVPTTPDLAAAATFDMAELTWTLSGNVATLAYNLPRALVGKLVRVTFTGPFDPATGTAMLTGTPGTSVCTVTSVAVSCSETMQGLMPVNPDLSVVQKLAPLSYPGPAADRTTLAQQFAGDPIGVATIDFSRPGVAEPVDPVETGSGKGKP